MPFQSTSLQVFATVALVGLTVACGDEPESDNEPDNQSAQNQQNQQHQNDNDAQNDGDGIADPADACEEAIDRSATFDVPFPDGATGISAPSLMRVGNQLWATYLTEVEVGGQAVDRAYLVRTECDGEPLEGPVELATEGSTGELSPAIATDGEIAYLAWVETIEVEVEGEEGEPTTATVPRARAQAFDPEGTPMTDEPFEIEVEIPDREEPLVSLAAVDIAVDHDGNAVVAAQYAGENSANIVIQRLDQEGGLVGDGFFVEEDPEAFQSNPAVSVLDSYDVLFAYLHETGMGVGDVRHGATGPDGDSPTRGPTDAEASIGEGNQSQSVALSKNLGGDYTWMTYGLGTSANNTVKVRSGAEVGVLDGHSTSLSGRQSGVPDVTASETGGAKAWLSAGEEGAGVHFRRFEAAATGIIDTGPVVDQHGGDATAGSAPAIAWLTGDIYAAFWAEDGAPVGRVLDFEREEGE